MIKTHTCVTVHCDHCGDTIDIDGGIPHYQHEEQGMEDIEASDWHLLRDGRIYCTATACEAELPDCMCEGDECDAAMCLVGCPCLLHKEPKPGGPCPVSGCTEAFERYADLLWHQYKCKAAKAVSTGE